MKFIVAALSAAVIVGGASSASAGADDFASLIAAAQEHFGQSMGEALVGGQSIFVTAHGRAKLPSAPKEPYSLSIHTSASSAVEAARLLAAKLARMDAIAKRFGVEMESKTRKFSFGIDNGDEDYGPMAAMMARSRAMEAAPGATPSTPPAKVFIARSDVRFLQAGLPDPAFFDALHQAGVDDFGDDLNGRMNSYNRAFEMFGLGSAVGGDEATWSRASEAAVAAARAQAGVLAHAAGREVGEVRQMMMLTRSVEDGEAVVTVAVRFSFAPKH